MMNMLNRIKDLAREYERDAVALRRHFHAHPELSWQEARTTDRIAEELGKLGIPVLHRGYGGTSSGLIADIKGARPGRCVALRSDIDALPIHEENDVEYRSKNDGVMHACGHDGHMAGLLTAARILMQIRDELPGTVRLLFQPAEEDGPRGGARVMIQEGALQGVDGVFGLHLFSLYPAGKVLYRSGPCMASADGWDLVVTGKGGHGAAPEKAVDPVVAACTLGCALQTIVSREVAPTDTAVISITSVESPTKTRNIIPESVTLMGATRALSPEMQDRVEAAMRRIAEGVALTTRCRIDLNYMRFYPAVINDPKLTQILKETAEAMFGADAEEAPVNMGSEDFSFYGRAVPATFAQLGVGDPAQPGTRCPHHSPTFNLDEAQLKRAAALHAGFAWSFLNGD